MKQKTVTEIEIEAATWIYRSQDPEAIPETRACRDAWLENQRNAITYIRMAADWERARELIRAHESELTNVRPWYAPDRWIALFTEAPRLLQAAVVLSAGFLVTLFATTCWHHYQQATSSLRSQVFKTELGEQRHVILTDGSRVDLNTDSVMSVYFSAERRSVRLERGEAVFTVAPDKAHPFEVSAAGSLTRALGTEFNLRIVDDHAVEVLIAQGTVGLNCTAKTGAPVSKEASGCAKQLTVGHSATVRPDRIDESAINSEELQRRLSWTQGELRLDGPLPKVIAEINRYSRRKIVIDDPGINRINFIGRLRILDLTNSDNATFFADLQAFGVHALVSPDDRAQIRLVKEPQ